MLSLCIMPLHSFSLVGGIVFLFAGETEVVSETESFRDPIDKEPSRVGYLTDPPCVLQCPEK